MRFSATSAAMRLEPSRCSPLPDQIRDCRSDEPAQRALESSSPGNTSFMKRKPSMVVDTVDTRIAELTPEELTRLASRQLQTIIDLKQERNALQDENRKLRRLLKAVQHCRDAQKMYFETKDRNVLTTAKRRETDVDRLLKSLPNLRQSDDDGTTSGTLFRH